MDSEPFRVCLSLNIFVKSFSLNQSPGALEYREWNIYRVRGKRCREKYDNTKITPKDRYLGLVFTFALSPLWIDPNNEIPLTSEKFSEEFFFFFSDEIRRPIIKTARALGCHRSEAIGQLELHFNRKLINRRLCVIDPSISAPESLILCERRKSFSVDQILKYDFRRGVSTKETSREITANEQLRDKAPVLEKMTCLF